jgi:hypothetical protein
VICYCFTFLHIFFPQCLYHFRVFLYSYLKKNIAQCLHLNYGCFFRSTTPYTLIGIIDRAHQRVRMRASKSVGAVVSLIERSTELCTKVIVHLTTSYEINESIAHQKYQQTMDLYHRFVYIR